MTNKEIFAKNLQSYMDANNKSRKDVCNALGFNYYTFTDWVNAKKLPRMDKVQKLADYFGIRKSDLIEEKMTEEKEKDNEIMADIIVRMRSDAIFYDVVKSIYFCDSEKIEGIQGMLQAFTK